MPPRGMLKPKLRPVPSTLPNTPPPPPVPSFSGASVALRVDTRREVYFTAFLPSPKLKVGRWDLLALGENRCFQGPLKVYTFPSWLVALAQHFFRLCRLPLFSNQLIISSGCPSALPTSTRISKFWLLTVE